MSAFHRTRWRRDCSFEDLPTSCRSPAAASVGSEFVGAIAQLRTKLPLQSLNLPLARRPLVSEISLKQNSPTQRNQSFEPGKVELYDPAGSDGRAVYSTILCVPEHLD